MIDTVLFDLDGTLINTNYLIIDSFKYVFKKRFPNIILTEDDYLKFIGPSLYESFSRFSNNEEEIQSLIDEYRSFNIKNHDYYVKQYNNLVETLSELSKSYKLGIVSTKKLDTVYQGLDLFDIRKYFSIIVANETVKSSKPNPEGIFYAMNKLNSIDAIFVGDNKTDILAGKNANLKTIGVSYTFKLKDLLESNPDYMIDDLSEIIDILGGLQ